MGSLEISLFGAAPDTGNLGVSALCYATLLGLADRLPGVQLNVFDHGRGRRECEIEDAQRVVRYTCYGASHSRRLYRAENLHQIRVSARLGGLGNAAADAIGRSTAVLDISGGDSFTDLYGPWRFRSICLPKLIALEAGVPLILLPQTYGPFASNKSQHIAQRIVRQASMAWARDPWSFDIMRKMLGDVFDPDCHRLGVDVAFELPPKDPGELIPCSLRELLTQERSTPVVGVNVSGLLWNDPQRAASQYHLKADYRQVVLELVGRLLSESEATIVLVPHVVTKPGHFESDLAAGQDLARAIDGQERVVLCPQLNDPREIKWVISKMSWFCGTRMHSTIAALSSSVPVAAIAYSPKTLGVFETCGQGRHVADPRKLCTIDVIKHLWSSWEAWEQAKADLALHLPGVLRQAEEQMDAIADFSVKCD